MLEKLAIEAKTLARLGLAFVFYLLPLLVFARLAVEAVEKSPPALDISILQWLHQFSNPALTQVNLFITNAGSPVVIVAITIIMALVLYRFGRQPAALVMVLGVGGAAIVTLVSKIAFQRARPHLWTPVITESSFAFPSGHAMISSAFAFTVIYLLWHTRWRWLAIFLGLLTTVVIGLTRLYLGVHFPTDVIAGWVVGFIWVIIMRSVLRWSHMSS